MIFLLGIGGLAALLAVNRKKIIAPSTASSRAAQAAAPAPSSAPATPALTATGHVIFSTPEMEALYNDAAIARKSIAAIPIQPGSAAYASQQDTFSYLPKGYYGPT